jgi:hypothetical protein
MIITQMLNKIGGRDFELHEQKLIAKFTDIYAQIEESERTEFISAIALRLVSRAKTCRSTGHIFAKLFKSMSRVDL